MRKDRINSLEYIRIKFVLILLLLCIVIAPDAHAKTEEQECREDIENYIKQGGTYENLVREYEKHKSAYQRAGSGLDKSIIKSSMEHYEKMLKYWPTENNSSNNSIGSSTTFAEQPIGVTLSEIANESNELVILKSRESSIGDEMQRMQGDSFYVIPVDEVSYAKSANEMESGELLGMLHTSHKRKNTNVGNYRHKDILTDDVMGSNSVSSSSSVNDISVSEYEEAVNYWIMEMNKYDKASKEYQWAEINYNHALEKLALMKKNSTVEADVNADLNMSSSSNIAYSHRKSKNSGVGKLRRPNNNSIKPQLSVPINPADSGNRKSKTHNSNQIKSNPQQSPKQSHEEKKVVRVTIVNKLNPDDF